jgi:hypothetical protein
VERSAGGQALVMGIVLILTGVVYLAIELVPRLRDLDVARYGWPLFIIVPGLALIGVAGALPDASGLCVPGAVVVMAGLILFWQNVFDLFATTTYTWALVVPGGVGLGLWLQGMVDGSQPLRVTGARTLGTGFVTFLLCALLFESLHVSGAVFPGLIRLLLGVVIIAVGVVVIRRSSAADVS